MTDTSFSTAARQFVARIWTSPATISKTYTRRAAQVAARRGRPNVIRQMFDMAESGKIDADFFLDGLYRGAADDLMSIEQKKSPAEGMRDVLDALADRKKSPLYQRVVNVFTEGTEENRPRLLARNSRTAYARAMSNSI